MTVGVAIVNYNTGDLTLGCLESIERFSNGAPPRIVVVDNASPDKSGERLRDEIAARNWSAWATLVPSETNTGFAGGNNLAFEHLLTLDPELRYLHLLNPDTEIREGAIAGLVEFLDAHPHVGLAGSRLEHPDATPQRSAFRDPTPLGEFESAARCGPVSKLLAPFVVAPPVRDDAHQTDWVAGASLMIRREVYDTVGPLDDAFFMYYEEIDYCQRARAAGFECWYVPASRVVHLVGKSSGIVHGRPSRRPAYWFESRRRYFRKRFGITGPALADAAWLTATPIYHAWRILTRKPDTNPNRFTRDLLSHSMRALPRVSTGAPA